MSHKQRYKNAGLDSSEMRRRREEEGIQLRKQKREQQLIKRRNVDNVQAVDNEFESALTVSNFLQLASAVINVCSQFSFGISFAGFGC